MEVGRKPKWEQERRKPIRARNAKDVGGPPGPSNSKSDKKKNRVKDIKECRVLCLAL